MANSVILTFAEHMVDTHKKAERAFGGNQKLEKKFADLVKAKMKSREGITYFELNNKGLLKAMETYLGHKIKADGISPDMVSTLNDDLVALRVYEKSDTKTIDGIEQIKISLQDLGVTGDPAKQLAKDLKKEFGIEKAGKEGISHPDALQLQEAIEKSDVFKQLGTTSRKAPDAEGLTSRLDLLQQAGRNVTLNELSKLGIDLKIDLKQAQLLFGTRSGIGRNDTLTPEQIDILKDHAQTHQKVSKLGITPAARKELDTRVENSDHFLTNASDGLHKAVVKHQGMQGKHMDFLHQHAVMTRDIPAADLINLHNLLGDYMNNRPLLTAIGIPSPDAANAVKDMIESHVKVRNQLNPDALDSLIAETSKDEVKKNGLDPNALKQYLNEGVDRNALLAETNHWQKATKAAQAAHIDPIQDANHPVLKEVRGLREDPANLLQKLQDYADQVNVPLNVMQEAAQSMQHINEAAIHGSGLPPNVQNKVNNKATKAQIRLDSVAQYGGNRREVKGAIKDFVKQNHKLGKTDDIAKELKVTPGKFGKFGMQRALKKAMKSEWTKDSAANVILAQRMRDASEARAHTP